MDFTEFSEQICNKRAKGTSKIRNSFGVYDAYKFIRKNSWFDIGRPLKEKEFYSIVRKVNLLLANAISLGTPITFPERMGTLELRKRPTGVSIINGKLRITYPVDWASTLRLWFEDSEEREKKTLLRFTEGETYHVKYCKYYATYENKSFYEFALNRFIKKALSKNIKKGLTNTLW